MSAFSSLNLFPPAIPSVFRLNKTSAVALAVVLDHFAAWRVRESRVERLFEKLLGGRLRFRDDSARLQIGGDEAQPQPCVFEPCAATVRVVVAAVGDVILGPFNIGLCGNLVL